MLSALLGRCQRYAFQSRHDHARASILPFLVLRTFVLLTLLTQGLTVFVSCQDLLLRQLYDLVVVFEYVLEHMGAESQGETRRDRFLEVFELLLRGHCNHDLLEVLSDVLTHGMGQLDVCHGCIRQINDLLLLLRLASDLADEDGDFTDDVGLVNRAHQIYDDHEN